MPSKDTKISDFNQYWKSDKTLSTNYADLWFLLKKLDGFKKNPEKFSTKKVREHIPCGYSMSTISTFHGIDNKLDVYRVK